MAETIYVRGEGGQIIAMDLPLPEHLEERLTSGRIRRVHEDGKPYREDEDATPARPADSAVKGLWVGWAVAQGATPDAAEAMTKQDLIDTYGG